MKKTLFALVLIVTMLFVACSSNEQPAKETKKDAKPAAEQKAEAKPADKPVDKMELCKKAVPHLLEITLSDPTMSPNEDMKAELRKKYKENEAKSLEECARDEQKVIECILAAKDMKQVFDCKKPQAAPAPKAPAAEEKKAEEKAPAQPAAEAPAQPTQAQ